MELSTQREKCYRCYRPLSSCMCSYIHPLETNTKFIILMHPKEFKKVKNGTGHLTHLSLKNSELFVGIDFTNHKRINEIIQTHESYILYPSKKSHNLSDTNLHTSEKKDIAIFLIDSTWACSVKILRESKNLHPLAYVSFDATKVSEFTIKEQPEKFCLSTIESTLSVLELLNKWNIENFKKRDMENFLMPFYKMIEYQLECIKNPKNRAIRYKKRMKRDSITKNKKF